MRSLRGADGLRAIACLMVIFHHLAQKLNFDAIPPTMKAIGAFMITGAAGVSVFFILSGFLLAMPFWDAYLDGNKRPDLRVYALRRAGRIVPGFFLNMVFCFFLGVFFFPDAPSLIWRYLAGMTFTSSFHWLSFFPSEMNGPLWSISFEVVSYILMPVGMVLLFRFLGEDRSFRKAIVFWIKFYVVAYVANELVLTFVEIDRAGQGWQYGVVGGAKFWMPRYNPIGMFGHFCLGVIAAGVTAWWSRSARVQANRRWFDLASLACALLWVGFLVGRAGQPDFSFNLQDQPYYYPAFPALSALLLACLCQSSLMGRIFDNPLSRFLARISFGLYLWHYLVMLAITHFVPSYEYGRISNLGLWTLLAAITLVASTALATASWYWLEKPILARAQAWRPRLEGPRFVWTGFTRFAALACAILLVVPPLVATVVRPSAWAFPKPYFVAKGEKLRIPEGRGNIRLQVSGKRPAGGNFEIFLYRGGFDDGNLVAAKSVPAADGAVVEFEDLPFTEYAIRGYHDENTDGKLDWKGNMPSEGLIQAKSPTRQDDFDSLKFVFQEARMQLGYTVYYLQ